MNTNKNHIILCVDDDPDDLQILQDALKAVGPDFSIEEANNGADALLRLKHMKQLGKLPCLIVLDINMPKVDGKQTLVSIQADEALRSVPVVIFTTSSSAIDKLFFSKKNVELITKPATFESFFAVASKLLSYCKD